MRTRQRGMSIIEAVVALGIVALVMGFAAPAAQVWIQNANLRNAAESLLNGMQTARLEALKQNKIIAFEVKDPNTAAWHVCPFDPVANTCQASAADLAAKPAGEGSPNVQIGLETTFTTTATPIAPGTNVPSLVAFDSFGRIAPTSPVNIAHIDVRNTKLSTADERRLSILVTASGQIRMCDPQLPKATNPQGCQ